MGGPPVGPVGFGLGGDGRWDLAGIGVSSSKAGARTHYVQLDHSQ